VGGEYCGQGGGVAGWAVQPVKLGQALLPGEVVRTGAGSRVAIQLLDKSQLKINANSHLELK
jgi:ferric-dicitrate binding protein FerR (iron transport regulator)